MKIIELSAQNVKRIKAINIKPVDNTVLISGENGAGKSSAIDSIWLALDIAAAGKDLRQPIRKGQDKAKVTLDLGDIQVTRTWTQKGSYLKVEPKEIVNKYGGAQSVLDAFIGKLSFDPMEFLRYANKDQRETLLKLVNMKIDLDKWEVDRKKVYDERTEANKKVKEYELKVEQMKLNPVPTDTPDKEIDIATAANDLQNARDINTEYIKAKDRLIAISNEIGELQKEQINLNKYITKVDNDGLLDVDKKFKFLSNVNVINANVRLYNQYQLDLTELDSWNGSYEALNNSLEEMETEKQEAIKLAKFPVDGLGFDVNGVTYNDIPISQISTSEQIKVSMSIAMALNPNLKVIIIKEGSLLDDKNLKIVMQMVKDKDYQLWVEKVDSSGKLGIVIEDGGIKEVMTNKEAEKKVIGFNVATKEKRTISGNDSN